VTMTYKPSLKGRGCEGGRGKVLLRIVSKDGLSRGPCSTTTVSVLSTRVTSDIIFRQVSYPKFFSTYFLDSSYPFLSSHGILFNISDMSSDYKLQKLLIRCLQFSLLSAIFFFIFFLFGL
jgi:hypothetical protein